VHHPLQRFIKVALCSEEEGSSANQRLDPSVRLQGRGVKGRLDKRFITGALLRACKAS